MFGSGELQAFGEAIHLASTLYQWREEHRLSAEESSKGEDATHEYGAQIPFTFDSNFLLRMFIEPGVGLEQTAPEEWQDQQLSGWEGAEDEEVTLDWLPNQCERHIQISGAAFSVAELSASILRVLSARSSKSDAQLQNQLYDLLGETGFEFIRLLIDKRTEILRCYASSQGEPAHAQAQIGANGTAPAPGLQFSITSEEEKHLLKLQRKDNRKRARRAQASGANSIRKSQEEWLSEVGWNTQVLRQQREEELQQGPGDLEDLLPQGTTTDFSGVGGRKILLPQGTVRRDKHRYEEVQVPYVKPEPFGTDEALVAISEFDPWARVAFEGVTKLNRIQSRVFQAAYRSNENLLICAPTGAGKTNVAMMTILHEVGQHFLGGYLQRDKFKIVYIAPMKALAQEMVRNFGNRLQKLGILVKELTGDVQLTRREITETQMIVTTPEKWDVITRKTSDMALAQMVRLLIIDEVHLLHEDRGPVIETLVARTLRQVESTQSMIRIVGLSATLPNYEDVAVFLRVNPKTGLFHFNNAYRPVPLTQQYIGVKETDAVARKTLVNKIAYTKAKQTVMQGQQAMVFVHSRKGTVKTAQLLGEIAQTKGTITFFMPDTSDPQYMTALKEVSKSRNRELKELFPLGLGIHHAGMLRADRSLVERLFSQGYIKVLCCTSTLAWGVNLPAHTVIIAGTELYDSKQGVVNISFPFSC
jgi:activating signal cointegrator complex subunit 3